MGLFSGIIKAATNIFRAGFNALGKLGDLFGNDANGDIDATIEKFRELSSKYMEDISYANEADESYRALIYNNLSHVPVINLYDPNYGDYTSDIETGISKIDTILSDLEITKSEMMAAQATQAMFVDNGGGVTFDSTKYDAIYEELKTELQNTATEIQTYLREDTSDLEAAKLWDAKFIKAVKEHIPPHLKGGNEFDATMSQVMEAFRNWSSFAQSQIDMFGSQNLINAVYEAVTDGEDAMGYMSTILDINARASSAESFGGGALNENENITVPNAGFFGSGFFF